MKALIFRSVLLVLGIFILFSCKNSNSGENPEELSSRNPLHVYKKKKAPKAFDAPEEYSIYFTQIRTRYGDSFPAYGYNYKLEALARARQNGPRVESHAVTFTERGPANVPGRTRAILPDPADPVNTWIAASVSGGIWRTTNGGQNWVDLTPELPNLMFTTLAQSPSNPNIIYAGTGERALGGAMGDGDGLFKSTDRGNTWTQLSVGTEDPYFQNISRVIVSPDDPNLVLACGGTEDFGNTPSELSSGVFKSTDGGSTWTRTFSHNFSISQIISSPLGFHRLYLSIVGLGVYRSDDQGQSWYPILDGLPEKVNRLELTVGKNPNWIFASLERGNSDDASRVGELYYTLNGGLEWKEMQSVEGGIDRDLLGGQGWYDNTIMLSPFTDSTLYVGGVNLWQVRLIPDGSGGFLKDVGVMVDSYSDAEGADKGKNSWFRGGVHPDQHFLTAIPGEGADQFRILLGNDGGIFVSQSSQNPGYAEGSWNMVGNTYNTTQFYGADKRPGFQQYVGGAQDNGTWIFSGQLSGQNDAAANNSSPYNFIIGGDGFEVVWNKADPTRVLGGSQFNNFATVNLSTGASASATQGLDDVGRGDAPFISRLANVATDPDLVYTSGSSGLWRSDDFGKNWSLTPLDSWFGSPDVAISLANPQIVWVATGMAPGRDIYVSTDGGNTLEPANQVADIGRITGIYTDPLDERAAYLLFSQKGVAKIMRTKDLGKTWEDLTGFSEGIDRGFPDVAVFSLQVMPYNADILWAGTEIGIFESKDEGQSWHLLNAFPKVMVWDMKWVDDEIVMATYGRGIWTATIPDLAAVPLPDPVLGPRILCLTSDLSTRGTIVLEAELRDAYDSSQLIINGVIKESFAANASPSLLKKKYAQQDKQDIEAILKGYNNGKAYASGKIQLAASDQIDFILPITSYSTNFDHAEDFALSGFEVGNVPGFPGSILHTDHPYKSGQDLTGGVGDYIAVLKFPIVVSISDPFMRYKDVALVELGEAGSVFGQSSYYDFVVVEGSKDLKNWIALSDGYDAGFNSKWKDAYLGNRDGEASLFVDHELDLSKQFSPGDTIAIRFRLFSDPLATGWGWAIDDLEIQSKRGGIDFENLDKNIAVFPSPTHGPLTVLLNSKFEDEWPYRIMDSSGKVVQEGQLKVNGLTVLTLDLTALAAGMYFLQLVDEKEAFATKKIVKY